MELIASREEASNASRPILVSIVALLIFVGSLLAVIAGVTTYLQREVFLTLLRRQLRGDILRFVTPETVVNFAIILVGYGVIHLALAYGLWTGRNWARRVSLLLSAAGLVVFLPGVLLLPEIAIPVVAFAIFILYYFMRPKVREFFRY